MSTPISDRSRAVRRGLRGGTAFGGAAAMLLLAGCGDAGDNVVIPETAVEAGDAATTAEGEAADGRIECAPIGSDRFERSCTVDRVAGTDGTILTVRQPDGGFHRLLVSSDGDSIVSADGAEPARVRVLGEGGIEVAVGGARYRLPATGGAFATP